MRRRVLRKARRTTPMIVAMSQIVAVKLFVAVVRMTRRILPGGAMPAVRRSVERGHDAWALVPLAPSLAPIAWPMC